MDKFKTTYEVAKIMRATRRTRYENGKPVRCPYCKSLILEDELADVAHIQPASRRGLPIHGNLVYAHRICNQEGGAQVLDFEYSDDYIVY